MLKSSPARWLEVPLPPEPKFISPGFVFASRMNSASVLAGTEGWVTMTFGTVATRLTGAKSLTAAYLSLGYRLGLITRDGATRPHPEPPGPLLATPPPPSAHT